MSGFLDAAFIQSTIYFGATYGSFPSNHASLFLLVAWPKSFLNFCISLFQNDVVSRTSYVSRSSHPTIPISRHRLDLYSRGFILAFVNLLVDSCGFYAMLKWSSHFGSFVFIFNSILQAAYKLILHYFAIKQRVFNLPFTGISAISQLNLRGYFSRIHEHLYAITHPRSPAVTHATAPRSSPVDPPQHPPVSCRFDPIFSGRSSFHFCHHSHIGE